jgi:hypothetical protein
MIALAAAAAAFAGLELVERGRLVPLGWWVLVTAPAEAVTLLVANWREHVSQNYASGLITATVFLLSGLVVATLRLLVREGSRAGRAGFAAVTATTIALDVLALVVTWTHSLPQAALRGLLSLVFATLLLYLLTPLVQRSSGPARRG